MRAMAVMGQHFDLRGRTGKGAVEDRKTISLSMGLGHLARDHGDHVTGGDKGRRGENQRHCDSELAGQPDLAQQLLQLGCW